MGRSYYDTIRGFSYQLEEVADEITLLHYGTTLQHDKIHRLMKRLKGLEEWRNPNQKDRIRLNVHFFDFNERMGNTVYSPIMDYLLTKEQFDSFEKNLELYMVIMNVFTQDKLGVIAL